MRMDDIRRSKDRRQAIIDAKQLGYEIILNRNGDTVEVTFIGKYNCPYTLPYLYASDVPDDAIRQDCAYELLHWANLKYETKEGTKEPSLVPSIYIYNY